MTTELITERQTIEPILISVTEDTITTTLATFASLRIDGVEDKIGLAAVVDARKQCQRARITIEKERVSVKAEYLEAGRKIDLAAKKLTAMLAPEENRLLKMEETIEAERKKISDAVLDARLLKRTDLLEALGIDTSGHSIRTMDEKTFSVFVEGETEALRLRREAAEKARLEKIESDRIQAEKDESDRLERERREKELADAAEANRLERDRLAAEKKILDDQRAAQQAEADRIEAEKRRLEQEEFNRLEAMRREEEEEARHKEVSEQLKQDADAAVERLAREAEEKRLADEAVANRAAALLPDREKILGYASQIELIETPTLSTDSFVARELIIEAVRAAVRKIRKFANELS